MERKRVDGSGEQDVIADLRARSIVVVMVSLVAACTARSEGPEDPQEPVCAEGASNVDGTCRCEASHIGAICEEGGGGVRRFCAGPQRCVAELPIPNVALATSDDLYWVTSAPPCSAGIVSWHTGPIGSGARVAVDGTMPIVMDVGRPLGGGCQPVHVFACPDGTCDATTTLLGRPLNYGDQPTVLPYLVGVVDGNAIMRDHGELLSCPTTDCSTPRSLATGLDVVSTFSRTDALGTAIADANAVHTVTAAAHTIIDVPRHIIRGLALDRERIYWATDIDIFACSRADTATCTPERIAIGSAIDGLVVDDDSIYWTDNRELMHCAKGACTPSRLLTCGEPRPQIPLTGLSYLEAGPEHLYCPGFATDFPFSTLEIPKH